MTSKESREGLLVQVRVSGKTNFLGYLLRFSKRLRLKDVESASFNPVKFEMMCR